MPVNIVSEYWYSYQNGLRFRLREPQAGGSDLTGKCLRNGWSEFGGPLKDMLVGTGCKTLLLNHLTNAAPFSALRRFSTDRLYDTVTDHDDFVDYWADFQDSLTARIITYVGSPQLDSDYADAENSSNSDLLEISYNALNNIITSKMHFCINGNNDHRLANYFAAEFPNRVYCEGVPDSSSLLDISSFRGAMTSYHDFLVNGTKSHFNDPTRLFIWLLPGLMDSADSAASFVTTIETWRAKQRPNGQTFDLVIDAPIAYKIWQAGLWDTSWN